MCIVFDIITALPYTCVFVFSFVKHIIYMMDINSYFGVTTAFDANVNS